MPPMKTLVAGGTGTLGRPLVGRLVAAGSPVRILSRRPGAADAAADGAERVVGDLTTGAGLAAALDGVDVVVDVANGGPRPQAARAVLLDGTRRLLEAAAAAGVSHYVLISIVGIEHVPFGYYRIKVQQERLVENGALPWTVLRATQFHSLLDRFFTSASRLPVLPLPNFPMQPVDPAEVAAALADAVAGQPAGRLPDVAGPQVLPVGELARQWLAARGRRRLIVPIPLPGRLGAALRGGALTAPDRAVGTVSFRDWLTSALSAASQ